MTLPQFPPQAPEPFYPAQTGAPVTPVFGGSILGTLQTGFRLLPDTGSTNNPTTDLTAFPATASPLTNTVPTTYVVTPSNIAFVPGTGQSNVVITTPAPPRYGPLGTQLQFLAPLGTTFSPLPDGTILVNVPSGASVSFNTLPQQPVGGIVFVGAVAPSGQVASVFTQVTGSALVSPTGQAISAAIGSGQVVVESGVVIQGIELTSSLAPSVLREGLRIGTQASGPLIASAIPAPGLLELTVLSPFVVVLLYKSGQVSGKQALPLIDDKQNEKQPRCLSDADVDPIQNITVCEIPPIRLHLGTGDIPPPGSTTLTPVLGAWDSCLGADGMRGALAAMSPPTGPFLPSFVEGMFPFQILYDAWCFNKPTLHPGTYDGYNWSVPAAFGQNLQGFTSAFETALRTGKQLPNGSVGGYIDPVSRAIRTSGPKTDSAAGFGGLRIGAAWQGAPLNGFGVPKSSQLHWLQVNCGNLLQYELTFAQTHGNGGLGLSLADAAALLYSQVASGLFWQIDTGPSKTNPFYDLVGLANDIYFVDQPGTSVFPMLQGFVLALGWYLQNDRRTPADLATTLTIPASGGPGNYVFIANWLGIDWFAAPGDPFNMRGGWANALASDAGYNPPPIKSCGNMHFRNDFVNTQWGQNATLYVPTAAFNAAFAAIGSITGSGCLGGTQASGPTFNGTPSQNVTPIAISSYGFWYAYTTGSGDGTIVPPSVPPLQ